MICSQKRLRVIADKITLVFGMVNIFFPLSEHIKGIIKLVTAEVIIKAFQNGLLFALLLICISFKARLEFMTTLGLSEMFDW